MKQEYSNSFKTENKKNSFLSIVKAKRLNYNIYIFFISCILLNSLSIVQWNLYDRANQTSSVIYPVLLFSFLLCSILGVAIYSVFLYKQKDQEVSLKRYNQLFLIGWIVTICCETLLFYVSFHDIINVIRLLLFPFLATFCFPCSLKRHLFLSTLFLLFMSVSITLFTPPLWNQYPSVNALTFNLFLLIIWILCYNINRVISSWMSTSTVKASENTESKKTTKQVAFATEGPPIISSQNMDGYRLLSGVEQFYRGETLEKQIIQAVQNNFSGFYLMYQPIVDIHSAKVVSAEALLRWKNLEDETISPIEFIPILERTGAIVPTENWIVHSVCNQICEWKKSGLNDDFVVHINLSASYLNRDNFFRFIQEELSAHQLQGKNLMLEITESALALDSDELQVSLNSARSSGLRIAMDDFGTGYSSLSQMRNFPLDEIKIDKSFLTNIAHNVNSQKMLDHIVNLSKSLGYRVCAEGVELEEEYLVLRKTNVDLIQGFLFSKPLFPSQFQEKYIENCS